MRTADNLLRAKRFDFLVFRLGILPLAAVYITRRYRIPYAIKTLSLGAFDAFHMQTGYLGILGKALAPLNEHLYRYITSRASAIDVCTPAHIDYFERRLSLVRERLECIENATNAEHFRPVDRRLARSLTGLSGFDPIIGFVGGRPSERGGAQMVEIARWLLGRYPKLGVVIVGDPKRVTSLRQRAHDLGVADRCVFPGLIPYHEVPNYVNAFDVGFSFDRKERTTRIGNSSQKVRQYVACGIPVVSGPGGNSFLEEEGLGSIVDTDDLFGIAKAAARWLSVSDAQRASHRAKAVRYARTHLTVEKALVQRLDLWTKKTR